jgi:hypothetical protein
MYHPLTPFGGQHYKLPVESIDVYATINDMLQLPKPREEVCEGVKCKPLQGKSLGPVLLGQSLYSKYQGAGSSMSSMLTQIKSYLSRSGAATGATGLTNEVMPALEHNFAISQAIRCAPIEKIPKDRIPYRNLHKNNPQEKQPKEQAIEGGAQHKSIIREHYWQDCDTNDKRDDKKFFTTLGYSMRTPEYRYTCYFLFNRATQLPEIDQPPFEEELYDHKNETLKDFTHREIYNLAVRPVYGPIMDNLRAKLVKFIKEKVKFGDH